MKEEELFELALELLENQTSEKYEYREIKEVDKTA